MKTDFIFYHQLSGIFSQIWIEATKIQTFYKKYNHKKLVVHPLQGGGREQGHERGGERGERGEMGSEL